MMRRLARCERGNVAILFGLMAVPVLGLISTAIDYSRAVKLRNELQSLVDAAALAATSEFSKSGDATAATNRLLSFINDGLEQRSLSLLPDPVAGQPPTPLGPDSSKLKLENSTFDPSTASVTPKITARVDTTLLGLFDVPFFEVSAESKSGLAGKKLELSIMLDITGSMCNPGAQQPCSSGTKMTAMKDAAKDLLDIVFTGNASNTRVALVPFSSTVNVGSYVAAATGAASTRTFRYSCGSSRNPRTCTGTEYRTNCVIERSGSARFNDDAPGAGAYAGATWTTHSNRNCTPGAAASLVPLTNDRTALETKINGLQGQGGTAGHLGTSWAWYALSNKWATFWGSASAPEEASPKLLKAAVLMTDGDYNLCNGNQNCTTSAADAVTMCANMKEQGIRVFTVGFAIDDDSARNTLISCASPGDYHFPYSSADMRNAFKAIGDALVAGTAGPVLAN